MKTLFNSISNSCIEGLATQITQLKDSLHDLNSIVNSLKTKYESDIYKLISENIKSYHNYDSFINNLTGQLSTEYGFIVKYTSKDNDDICIHCNQEYNILRISINIVNEDINIDYSNEDLSNLIYEIDNISNKLKFSEIELRAFKVEEEEDCHE